MRPSSRNSFLNDPTRKLKVPNHLRPKDKQVLHLGADAARRCRRAARRDRALLMLDMTRRCGRANCSLCAGAPSTIGTRCRSPKPSTRGRSGLLAKPGRVSGIFICHPDLAAELLRWKGAKLVQESSRPMRSCFRIREAAFMDTGNYRNRVLKPLAEKLRSSKAEFPDSAPNDGDTGAADGIGEGHSGSPAALEG